MARLTKEYAEVRFAAEEGHLDAEMLPIECGAVFGETEAGDVLLVPIAHRGASWGALRTAHYRSNALVLDPPTEEIDNDTVFAVQLQYYGLGEWTGDRWLHDDPIAEGGTIVGWQAEIRWRPSTSIPIDEEFTLRFSTGHTVSGPFDRRTLTAPLMITVESNQRRAIGEHLQRLDAVHALLAVAHEQTPLAAGGGVKFAESQRDYSPLWERTMISLDPPGETSHEFPHLGIDDVGGQEGVAAWVRLALGYRRAVEPVVRHALFVNQTPEARLLSTAAALEYWVANNARTTGWAKKRRGEALPGALARYVDPAWEAWIGDSTHWVERFWATYLDLKHFRTTPPNPRTVHALEVSGRWLLTAALLDHCTQTHAPSRHLFSTGLRMLGHNIRDELWDAPSS
jgi:hypothetical protein